MYEYFKMATTGLFGHVYRSATSFVDDFGDEIEFWMPICKQHYDARDYYIYHSSYDNLYI